MEYARDDASIKKERSVGFVKKLSDLRWKNIVVYDCEIKEPIGSVKNGTKIGWQSHELMGISVACTFDYETGDYDVYMDDNIELLAERLNRADLIVGFNHMAFDNQLLRKSGLALKPDSELKNYDILFHSRKAAGGGFLKGLKLDDHLRHMFGPQLVKTYNGADAPIFWQERKLGKLISYCLADVRRTRLVFEHIYLHGVVSTEAHGTRQVWSPAV